MNDSSPDPKTLDRLIGLIVAEADPLKIVLFGSAARNDMHDHSDIDLMVVVPEGADRLDLLKRLYSMDRGGLRLALDFVVTTPSSYERYKNSIGLIYRQVERDGRIVYAA